MWSVKLRYNMLLTFKNTLLKLFRNYVMMPLSFNVLTHVHTHNHTYIIYITYTDIIYIIYRYNIYIEREIKKILAWKYCILR